MSNQHKIDQLLSKVRIPGSETALEEVLSKPAEVKYTESGLSLILELGIPTAKIGEELASIIEQESAELNLDITEIELEQRIESSSTLNFSGKVAGVKNIIAVASGKGGVGKSTTSVNLALALVRHGACVGILDADIYGPSQAQMLGVSGERPQIVDGKVMAPIEAHGLQMISMANLVTEKTPMVWRGPMVSGALQQLLLQTQWNNVDYLIVDMPPGTGDIPLTLSQKVPVSTSVIVTTPQDIALLDAKKAIEMFQKVSIPVAGIVENMSVHICSSCGHVEHIFGESGGLKLAEDYGVELLEKLPLQASIRFQTDQGIAPVVAEPDSEVSRLYMSLAMKVATQLAFGSNDTMPEIAIVDD